MDTQRRKTGFWQEQMCLKPTTLIPEEDNCETYARYICSTWAKY